MDNTPWVEMLTPPLTGIPMGQAKMAQRIRTGIRKLSRSFRANHPA